MKTISQTKKYSMGLPVDKYGTSPSGANLPEVEKSAIVPNSYTNNEFLGPHNRGNPNVGPRKSPTRSTIIHLKKETVKWSCEEYKLYMTAFYEA